MSKTGAKPTAAQDLSGFLDRIHGSKQEKRRAATTTDDPQV